MLSLSDLAAQGEHALRLCTSAGEHLSENVARAWEARTGVEILDGIGTTEMLHMFISNRPGNVHYGTVGRPVFGYQVRLVDGHRQCVPTGEIGDLEVSGPSSALCYWNKREQTRATFMGEWTRTGDKFRETPEGEFVYCGRADDMMKVGGIWVSPVEVESALLGHKAVLDAAVVAAEDEDGLVKPKAFVVLKSDASATDELAQRLKDFVKARLAPYKYPRSIEFVAELPRTATGKLQRYRLRTPSGCTIANALHDH